MSFNVQKRMVIDNALVQQLDEYQEIVAEEMSKRDNAVLLPDYKRARNAAARYRRLVKRIAGAQYKGHYYTGSGQQLVPGSTEVYFGCDVK